MAPLARKLNTGDILSLVIAGLVTLASPILLIWAVNTLFACGIVIGFKTWLAGMVLILLVRFTVKPSRPVCEHYYDDEDDDFESDDIDEFMKVVSVHDKRKKD